MRLSSFKTFGNSVKYGSRVTKNFSTYGRRAVTQVEQPSKLSMYGAIAAGTGIVALTSYQFMQDDPREYNNQPGETFAQGTRRQLVQTYGYLAGGLAATGVAATAIFQSGIAARMMTMSPMVLLGTMLVGGVGSLMVTRMIDYHENPVGKHAALGVAIGFQGLMMAPLAALGGTLLLRAAVMTACVTGSISLAAATAPSEAALAISGPVTLGLGLVLGSSLASIFFPGSKLLYNIIMWGGLAVHGGLMFVRTNQLVENAMMYPNRQIDPINNMLGIYIDTLAIFARIAMMMANGNSKRR